VSSIRVADVQDAAAIAHVHVQSWLTTYQGLVPEAYLASLNEADRVPLWQDWLTRDISVFVAEEQGRIVGFAAAGPIRESLEAYDAELYTIYILKHAQGHGIGRSLLNVVIDSLAKRGHAGMLVWVLEQNPAVRFYEHTGAKRVTSKSIEIGGASLVELALGWRNLAALSLSTAPNP
jgi:GNAT superfamily N-acetyltransferase